MNPLLDWTIEDSKAAVKEGWDLFDNSYYGMRIERCDEALSFPTDAEAVCFVFDKAMAGSSLHRKALYVCLKLS